MLLIYFLKDFIYLFSERGSGEKERERNIDVQERETYQSARNPGMFPNMESNWQPFGSQVHAQFTEPHQLGHIPVT